MSATIAELRNAWQNIVEKCKAENRNYSPEEIVQVGNIRAQMDLISVAALKDKEAQEAHARSIVAAQTINNGDFKNINEFIHARSISTGAANVGDVTFINDIVKQFETQSPIFNAHGNVQRRSTGSAYSYNKLTMGGQGGYVKTEGVAGRAEQDDEYTAGSTWTIVTPTFKTYSSEVITITQEMIEDSAANVEQEILSLGMAKATLAFDVDAVTALETWGTPTDTTDSGKITLAELTGKYLSIPDRNRNGIKYICNATMAGKLIALLENETATQASFIGLDKSSLIVDGNVDTSTVHICNPTLAIAIGFKQPVRVVKTEKSEGLTIEVQPRLAVGLRDATAVAGLKLKA